MKYYFTALALTALLSACDGGNSNTGAPTTSETANTPAIALGIPGTAEGVEFVVNSVDQRAQLGIAEAGMKAEPSETYVLARYTIKNAGTKPMGFMDRPQIQLKDGSGQSYEADLAAAAMAAGGLDEMNGMASDLNPNVSAKSVAVWKVDKAAFDKGDWKLVLASDPQLVFDLK